jgi:hypothetical protein
MEALLRNHCECTARTFAALEASGSNRDAREGSDARSSTPSADGDEERTAPSGSRASLYRVIESLRRPDVMGSLDALTDVLVVASGLVARACNDRLDRGGLRGLDEAFSRAIVHTRALRERLQAGRARSEYASTSHAAREVVGHLQAALHDDVFLSVKCPPGPAIVAADRPQLRLLFLALVEIALDAIPRGGTLSVEVVMNPVRSPNGTDPAVKVHVQTSGVVEENDPRLATLTQGLVSALGGTMHLHELLRGGTIMTVHLPGAR